MIVDDSEDDHFIVFIFWYNNLFPDSISLSKLQIDCTLQLSYFLGYDEYDDTGTPSIKEILPKEATGGAKFILFSDQSFDSLKSSSATQ